MHRRAIPQADFQFFAFFVLLCVVDVTILRAFGSLITADRNGVHVLPGRDAVVDSLEVSGTLFATTCNCEGKELTWSLTQSCAIGANLQNDLFLYFSFDGTLNEQQQGITPSATPTNNQWVKGVYGNAAQPGTAGIPITYSGLEFPNRFSMCMWVMLGGDEDILTTDSGNGAGTYIALKVYQQQISFLTQPLGSGGGENPIPGGALPLGQWLHLVFQYDGHNREVYLNGELLGIDGYSGFVGWNAAPFSLFPAVSASFAIDEFRIYKRVLSPREIRMHYKKMI